MTTQTKNPYTPQNTQQITHALKAILTTAREGQDTTQAEQNLHNIVTWNDGTIDALALMARKGNPQTISQWIRHSEKQMHLNTCTNAYCGAPSHL